MARLSTVRLSLLAASVSFLSPVLVAVPQGDAPLLKPGDPAPKLSIAEWVKGKPVESFKKGNAYVVEFWATWCGPCIQGMPDLTDVQKEWGPKGLTVISVTSEDPRNSLANVKTMVEEKGDVMGYTVAWDQGRATSDAWMVAARQNGIPCSFVVDKKGDVAWIGHPMWLDSVVEKVIAGKWHVAKDVEKLKEAEGRLNAIFQASRSDPKDALAKLESFAEDYPKVTESFGGLRFQLLIDARRFKEAGAVGKTLVDKAIERKNAVELNQIAWTIVDPAKDMDGRGLNLALKAAVAANRFTDGEHPAILDTLARVHFLKGDLEKAVEFQRTAVKKAKGTRLESELARTLEGYEAAEKKGGDEG